MNTSGSELNQHLEDNSEASGIHQKKALLLVRTPFQAWLAEKVLEKETVSEFDIIYFTQNDSAEDQHYYERLKAKARRTKYIFVPRQKYDIFNHIQFWLGSRAFLWGEKYNLTMLSSIESHVINAISNRFRDSELVTFDDGTANYNTSGVYFIDLESSRARLYRKIFGGVSLSVVKERISRHYTIQPSLENIVSGSRLFYVDGWGHKNDLNKPGLPSKTYFLGAPFSEFLENSQIKKLEAFARTAGVDVYVRHPREHIVIDLGVPFLEKNGLIAEEAILKDSQGHPIRLIGSLSSVMFNLKNVATQRLVLVPELQSKNYDLVYVAEKSGCKVVFF